MKSHLIDLGFFSRVKNKTRVVCLAKSTEAIALKEIFTARVVSLQFFTNIA